MNLRTLLDKLLGSADWGIHPDDHKRPGADAPVRVMPAPSRLYLPLSQHSGARPGRLCWWAKKVKRRMSGRSPGHGVRAGARADLRQWCWRWPM